MFWRFLDVERNIVVPDVLVTAVGKTRVGANPQFRVMLNPEVMPKLRVHDIYANVLRNHRGGGKDSASYAVAVLVFGGSAFLPKPVTRSIAFQGLGPDTPGRERALDRMLDQPSVQVTLRNAALIIGATNGLAGR